MKRLFMVFVVFCALQAATAGAVSFTNNGNGTVTDNGTGLMWQQGEPGTRSYAKALKYCEGLSLGGQTDWRLPTKNELIPLVDYSIPYPGATINTTCFPNTHAYKYWSSTRVGSLTDVAWYVNFSDGNYDYDYKFFDFYVRCVRVGQSGSLGTLANNCAATFSSSLVVHIPIMTFSGSNYWVDLQFNSTTGQLTVVPNGVGAVSDASPYSSCTASTLSSGGLLHIPVVMICGVSYWSDLQWNGPVSKVTGAGPN